MVLWLIRLVFIRCCFLKLSHLHIPYSLARKSLGSKFGNHYFGITVTCISGMSGWQKEVGDNSRKIQQIPRIMVQTSSEGSSNIGTWFVILSKGSMSQRKNPNRVNSYWILWKAPRKLSCHFNERSAPCAPEVLTSSLGSRKVVSGSFSESMKVFGWPFATKTQNKTTSWPWPLWPMFLVPPSTYSDDRGSPSRV